MYIFQDLPVSVSVYKLYLATPFTLEWNFRRGGLLLECVTRDTTVPISVRVLLCLPVSSRAKLFPNSWPQATNLF